VTSLSRERGIAGRPHRILLVDGATEESDVLASVLASCGYDMLTARSADEALASLRPPLPRADPADPSR